MYILFTVYFNFFNNLPPYYFFIISLLNISFIIIYKIGLDFIDVKHKDAKTPNMLIHIWSLSD